MLRGTNHLSLCFARLLVQLVQHGVQSLHDIRGQDLLLLLHELDVLTVVLKPERVSMAEDSLRDAADRGIAHVLRNDVMHGHVERLRRTHTAVKDRALRDHLLKRLEIVWRETTKPAPYLGGDGGRVLFIRLLVH